MIIFSVLSACLLLRKLMASMVSIPLQLMLMFPFQGREVLRRELA
jgi:hypothetical protein